MIGLVALRLLLASSLVGATQSLARFESTRWPHVIKSRDFDLLRLAAVRAKCLPRNSAPELLFLAVVGGAISSS